MKRHLATAVHLQMSNSSEQPPAIDLPGDLDTLLAVCRPLRHSTSWGNSDVYVYECDGRQFLVKTFGRHNWLARLLFGGSIRTEYSLLVQLARHCPSVAPLPYAMAGKYTLVMEFINDGQPLQSRRHYTDGTVPPPEFFLNLCKVLERLHRAGFAHGDFRRANLLITADNGVRIIDWGTGSHLSSAEHAGWLRRKLHRWRVRSDLFSLVKITESYYHGILPPSLSSAAQPGALLKAARFVRRHFYRHGLKRLFDCFRKDEHPHD